MKLGPVTKLDKRNTATSKKIDDDVMSKNGEVIVFFRFMANLQSCGSRIPDAWSKKLKCSLITNFYFTKPENRT